MEPRTADHLATAERNRQLANALLGAEAAELVRPPPHEWAVVVAFYAAVHYVNAYLSERQHYQPHTHEERTAAVARAAALRPATASYLRLLQLGFDARYLPRVRIRRAAAVEAVQIDLAAVATAVRQALSAGT